MLMLNDKGMWYNDYASIMDKILNFNRLPDGEYKNIVDKFRYKNVMTKFKRVFIDNL